MHTVIVLAVVFACSVALSSLLCWLEERYGFYTGVTICWATALGAGALSFLGDLAVIIGYAFGLISESVSLFFLASVLAPMFLGAIGLFTPVLISFLNAFSKAIVAVASVSHAVRRGRLK